ncbi:MAG: GFA family protein [Pseudomonadales bacterium]
MIQGSCLCGTVRFQIEESEILMMNNCHCSKCRKATGSAFGSFIFLSVKDFEWLGGRDNIQGFKSSPNLERAFCKTCGSSVPFETQMDQMGVPGGILDGDPKTAPEADIFTANRLPWYEIPESAIAFPAEESKELMDVFVQRSKERYKRG